MKRWLPLIFGVLFLAYLVTGVYEIRPSEQAVVRRFGRVDGDPHGPGLLIGLPWGMDQVDRVAVDEQRVLEVGYQEGGPAASDAQITSRLGGAPAEPGHAAASAWSSRNTGPGPEACNLASRRAVWASIASASRA